ncbi:MAG: hypothetical protein ABUK01_08840 [Leptospirales bacterium]
MYQNSIKFTSINPRRFLYFLALSLALTFFMGCSPGANFRFAVPFVLAVIGFLYSCANREDLDAALQARIDELSDTNLTWSQDAYVKASNAEGGDIFGSSVAISGDYMVVGAQQESYQGPTFIINTDDTSPTAVDSGTASASGAVYVFKRASNGDWAQDAYLKASNAGMSDYFGHSVSISGDYIAVGAWGEDSSFTDIQNGDNHTFSSGSDDDDNWSFSGAVYVFKKNGSGNWVQDAYLKTTNHQNTDIFGYAVAISGDYIVASSYAEDNSITTIRNGNDYVFTIAPTPGYDDDSAASSSGAIYVFKRDTDGSVTATTGDWFQDAYLKASNARAGIKLGRALAIDGNYIVAGSELDDNSYTDIQNGDNHSFTSAPSPIADDNNYASNSGAAYVFKRNSTNGNWSQDAYLKATNAEASDNFGESVSISGNYIAVGAKSEKNSYTTIQNGNNHVFTFAPDANADDNASSGAFGSGAVYVFKRDTDGSVTGTTGYWFQDAYLKASNAEGMDSFGISVAIDSEYIAVGASGEDNSYTDIQNDDNFIFTDLVDDNASASSSGAVYVFKRNSSGDWSQDAYLKASNADSSDLFGGSVAISGKTIVTGAAGESSNQTTITNTDGAASTDNSITSSGAVYIFKGR